MHPGESLNIGYLSPYLKALGSDYSNGANFAIAGSATLPRDTLFSLHIQVKQFLFFRDRSLELISQGSFVVYLPLISNRTNFRNVAVLEAQILRAPYVCTRPWFCNEQFFFVVILRSTWSSRC